jgi:ribosomal protein S18 acetylase RimI-like enzyme
MSQATNEGISPRPVAECTAAQVADALTRSFEGYLMPVNVTAEGYERRFRPENVDPFASYAAMAVAPEARGRGLGRLIMQDTVDEAAERGDRSVLLEVFEHNTPAVKLYERLGFRRVRKLLGYQHVPGGTAPGAVDALAELDPLEFARVVAREGEPGLPWMLAAETLSGTVLPARAFHLDHRAYALIGDPEADVATLVMLVVPRAHRRSGWGTRLVQALFARYPDKAWSIPQIVPEELAPTFFTRCGWTLMDTNQLEMVLALARGPQHGSDG